MSRALRPSARSAWRGRAAHPRWLRWGCCPAITMTTSPRGGVCLVIRRKLGDRSPSQLLVLLRQLAGHDRCPAIGTGLGELGQRSSDARRRLVQHCRVAQRDELLDRRAALRPFAGEKAEEGESVGLEPGGDERREQRGRAGHWRHVHARIDRRAHESRAGIREQRRSGVGDERQALATPAAARRVRASSSPRCARDRRRVARRSRSGRADVACVACPRRGRRTRCAASRPPGMKNPPCCRWGCSRRTAFRASARVRSASTTSGRRVRRTGRGAGARASAP